MKRDAYIAASESLLPVNDSYRVSADLCCNGDCVQGRLCPRYPQPSQGSWFWADLSVVGIACLVVVGFICGWFS